METVYIKKGRKYIPIGVNEVMDLYEGIYLVQKTEGGSMMNAMRVADVPYVVDVLQYIGPTMLASAVAKFFKKYIDAHAIKFEGVSIGDMGYEFRNLLRQDLFERGTNFAKLIDENEKTHRSVDTVSRAQVRAEEIADGIVAKIRDNKVAWHGMEVTPLKRLFDALSEINHMRVSEHQYAWILRMLDKKLEEQHFSLTGEV